MEKAGKKNKLAVNVKKSHVDNIESIPPANAIHSDMNGSDFRSIPGTMVVSVPVKKFLIFLFPDKTFNF